MSVFRGHALAGPILAMALLFCAPVAIGAESPGGKEPRSDTTPYSTTECFAFWKLLNKLEGTDVPALLAKGPPQDGTGLPPTDMERVTLYLRLEERLRFRCPDFVPPPARRSP